MIKCIIVEDDKIDSDRLIQLLTNVSHLQNVKHSDVNEQIEVLAVCQDINNAKKAIKEFKPELIFLDVELEDGETGFDLLKETDNINFGVIFTTKHTDTNTMIKVIRACALDFIPKPIDSNKLIESIELYLTRKEEDRIERVKVLKSNVQTDRVEEKTIVIEDSITISKKSADYRVKIQDIIYCESFNVSTNFIMKVPIDNKFTIESWKPINKWEDILEEYNIYRIHRSYLVNKVHVKGRKILKNTITVMKNIIDTETNTVILAKPVDLPISRTYRKRVLPLLGF